jgi:hypothetical protein
MDGHPHHGVKTYSVALANFSGELDGRMLLVFLEMFINVSGVEFEIIADVLFVAGETGDDTH